MSWHEDPLLKAYTEPRSMLELDEEGWASLVRRSRRHALLGKLAARAEAAGLVPRLPQAVQRQFSSFLTLSGFNASQSLAESYRLLRVLGDLDIPVVLLKGAAYSALQLAMVKGRVSSDVDLLVPHCHLEDAENLLLEHGWEALKTSAYDQAYYRRWMHELPPLRHMRRATIVDLHHTILPPTGRIRPDADALFSAAVDVALGPVGAKVLCPADMLLHAAVHMVQDGDFDRRLRDLIDIAELAEEFSVDPAFAKNLLARCRLHGAQRPVFHALSLAQTMLGSNAASGLARDLAGSGAPGYMARHSMERLAPWALLPEGQKGRPWARLARLAFYLRAHWLRMPPMMLARHLAVKLVLNLTLKLAPKLTTGWRERWRAT